MVEEQIAWLILSAVNNTSLGAYKLAMFLKGSKSKEVAHLQSERLYGGLLWFDIYTILNFIKQLEEMGFIGRKHNSSNPIYTLLVLTDAGKYALENKTKILLEEVKAPVNVGPSEMETYNLFKSGLDIQQIAEKRELTLSTIGSHFYKLVFNKMISCKEFIPNDKIKEITEKYKSGSKKLTELKNTLPEDVTYDEIRCVLTEMKH